MVHRLDLWHQTRLGHGVFGLAELLLTYSFASLAIARGNGWYYLLTLIFLVGTLRNGYRLIRLEQHGRR
jgi:hypothetical protein